MPLPVPQEKNEVTEKKVATPPALSESTKRKFKSAIKRGLPRRHAYKLLGESKYAIKYWLDRSDPKHPEHTVQYLNFGLAVEQAEAKNVERYMGYIEDVAPDKYKAALELLRIADPEYFGHRTHQTIEAKTEKKIEIDLSGMTLDQLREMMKNADAIEVE